MFKSVMVDNIVLLITTLSSYLTWHLLFPTLYTSSDHPYYIRLQDQLYPITNSTDLRYRILSILEISANNV